MSRAATLAARLRQGFGVLTALVTVIGAFAILSIDAATARIEHLSHVLTPAVEANARALQLMLDAETGVRGYLLTGRQEFLEPYDRARSEVLPALEEGERLAEQHGLEGGFDAEKAAARTWLEDYAEPALAAQDVTLASAVVGKRAFDQYRTEQAAVADLLTRERAVVRQEARSFRAVVVPAFYVITLLFVIAAGVVAHASVRVVASPLAELRAVLVRLREGEHTARAAADGPLEVLEVAQATNALADESDRLRVEQAAAARLRQLTREAARDVRDELDSDAVLSTAARVLGVLLEADHVLVRHGGEMTRAGRADGASLAQWHRDGLGSYLGLPPVPPSVMRVLRRCARHGAARALLATEATADDTALVAQVREVLPEVEALVVAPVTAGGLVVGMVVLAYRTPHRASEEQLLAVQVVVSDLGRALEHSEIYEQQLLLVDRLQGLDRQKTDFLSTVSHELRTPLTSIAGYTEMLRDGDAGELTAPMAGIVDVIARNAERLGALVEDLLTLSQIESGRLNGVVAPVDLLGVVGHAVQALGPQAGSGGVDLRTSSDGAPVLVQGDAAQLERAVLNLVSNAVKFTPAGGGVDVGLARAGGDVVLTVRDTGIGIPAGEQDQLTSRFFRASNAMANAVQGTGLGLSIVRGIVELHEGAMVLTSEEGVGTQVTVRLPAVEPGTDVPDAADASTGTAAEEAGFAAAGTGTGPSRTEDAASVTGSAEVAGAGAAGGARR